MSSCNDYEESLHYIRIFPLKSDLAVIFDYFFKEQSVKC